MSVHSAHPHRDVRGGWEGTHCKAVGASASLGQKGSGLNWAKHAETRCRQSESIVSLASLLSPPLIRTTSAGEIPTGLRQTKAPPWTVAPAGGQTEDSIPWHCSHPVGIDIYSSSTEPSNSSPALIYFLSVTKPNDAKGRDGPMGERARK